MANKMMMEVTLMDAWTELTQAAIRVRIEEREAEAAGERLATAARSAAARPAAAVRSIAAPARLPASVSATNREPTLVGEPIAKRPMPCDDCPAVSNAA
jgi:hypothetical protein